MNNSFTPYDGCLYRFISVKDSKMVIQVSQNPQTNMLTTLQEWNKKSHQVFAIRRLQNGKFAIFCAKNNFALKTRNLNNDDCNIIAGKPSKQLTQQWDIVRCPKDKFKGKEAYIIKAHNGNAMDICGGNMKNGTQIIVWGCHGNENQAWLIQSIDAKIL